MANTERKKNYKLSIYLIKKDVTKVSEVLKSKRLVDEYKLKGTLKLNGIIYIGKTTYNNFGWQKLLQQGTDKQIPELQNSSNRAVLLLKIEGRIYALPFGFGKYLLKAETIEREFGLKTALNLIDPDKLRSIDKANLDDLTLLTRTQTSRRAKPQEFNVDIIRDLMRGVTGEPASGFETLGAAITGSEGLSIIPSITFENISEHLKTLKKGYNSKAYKARFDWVDNLKTERDPNVLVSLEAKLIKSLKAKDTDSIHLAPPIIIDWESYEGFSFTPKGDLHTELDIATFYDARADALDDLDWDKLKRLKLFIKYADKDDAIPVSITGAINFQVQSAGYVYVLAFGQWYRVNRKYKDEIVKYVQTIQESKLPFVDCDTGMNEGKYNIKLAASHADFKLFDKVLVKSDAIRSRIEVCDVFAVHQKEFIHVKFKESSSVLSHLFSQGKISANLLARDHVFRQNLRTEFKSMGLSANLVPHNKIDCSDYTVTFAIIGHPGKTFIESLPFFSLLNFRLTVEELRLLGFNVKMKKINYV